MRTASKKMASLLQLSGHWRRAQRSFGIERVKDFIVKAWKDTYPDEEDSKGNYERKIASAKQAAVKRREEQEKLASYTEEQLAEVPEAHTSSTKPFPSGRGAPLSSLNSRSPKRPSHSGSERACTGFWPLLRWTRSLRRITSLSASSKRCAWA